MRNRRVSLDGRSRTMRFRPCGRIRRGRRIPVLQRCRHRVVVDQSGPASIASCQELAVPSRDRQPHFNLDVRVRRRCEPGGDTTEGRQQRQTAIRWSRRLPGRRPLCLPAFSPFSTRRRSEKEPVGSPARSAVSRRSECSSWPPATSRVRSKERFLRLVSASGDVPA